MLEEGIIRPALGWGAEEITAVLVVFKGGTVPLLDGVRRIGQDQIELLNLTAYHKGRVTQGVTGDNMEV